IERAWNLSRNTRKNLRENLAPLRRFLRAQLGRPWDKVYGEICDRINRDSAVQNHIWQHLMWEVVRDPVTLERNITSRWRRAFYYVDPATGLLREMPAPSSKRRRPLPWRDAQARRAAII